MQGLTLKQKQFVRFAFKCGNRAEQGEFSSSNNKGSTKDGAFKATQFGLLGSFVQPRISCKCCVRGSSLYNFIHHVSQTSTQACRFIFCLRGGGSIQFQQALPGVPAFLFNNKLSSQANFAVFVQGLLDLTLHSTTQLTCLDFLLAS